MPQIILSHGAWVELYEAWVSGDEARTLEHTTRAELDWQQRHVVLFGKRILQPRLIAWAGELPYRYSGQTLEPRPWHPLVLSLRERVVSSTGVDFNHVLVNRYRDGNDSMGYHADAEPELGPDPPVACVSLGACRRFFLRSRTGAGAKRPLVLELTHGSLLVMGGTCQRHYRHAVPREAGSPTAERLSLTFRKLLRAPSTHR